VCKAHETLGVERSSDIGSSITLPLRAAGKFENAEELGVVSSGVGYPSLAF
jgi:hypothetical protein